MTEIQLIWAWYTVQVGKLREQDTDRGDGIVPNVVWIALFVGGAILLAAILLGKAKTAADNVVIQ